VTVRLALKVYESRLDVSVLPKVEKIEPFRFSTDDVAAKDRIAVWREVLARVHLRLDVEPLSDAPLRATVEQHAWPSASLYFSETTPVCASRTPELIQDGNGDFRLVRVEGGSYQCSSPGISKELGDSDAVLLSSDLPVAIRYPGDCRVTSLRIRRQCLAGAIRGVESLSFQHIPSSRPLSLLNRYIELLREDGPPGNTVFAHSVASHLIELTTFALDPSRDRQAQVAGTLRQARLAAIRADVFANLSEVRLSAKTVALRHGITDRYVNLLFEETGQTFGDFVTEERLKLAYRLLTDPARSHKRIGDIAAEAGFGSLSVFNRAFRRRFGDAPRVIRRPG
jgi:AraC-like DNA-binding protein